MMLRNYSKGEKGCEAKEEGIILRRSNNNGDEQYGKYSFPKKTATTSSSRSSQWSGFRNPRIVRVSRSFGGKDRHSKVCTIRGLRDRRIRLSVPTAIQLYDLQDKLRLGQPSKVIDWLLDVTKLDIDKLPPLQIPTGFSQFHRQILFPQFDHHHHYSTTTTSSLLPPPPPHPFALDTKGDSSTTTMEKTTKLWDMDLAVLQEKASSATKGKWVMDNNDGSNHQQVEDYNEQISAQKQLLSMANNSTPFNYNTTTSSDQLASCLSLSQFGNHNNNHNNNNNSNGVFPSQVEAQTSCSSSSSHSSALFFTPYASYITNPFESHFHFLTSNSHAFSNNPFNMPSALHPFASQNLKPFPPANFNLKQFLHADNNAAPGSAKDGASAGNS